MYITFFFFFVEGSQNISSLGNRNVYYPVYFRLWGEEKHSKFRFSDAVLVLRLRHIIFHIIQYRAYMVEKNSCAMLFLHLPSPLPQEQKMGWGRDGCNLISAPPLVLVIRGA